MLVGRAAGSRLLRRFPARGLVFASLAVTGAGFLIFWRMDGLPLMALGLIVAGLGVANLYPSTLSLEMGAAPGQPDQASARASLASGTAILALPLLLGRLADLVGITPAFGLVGVLTVLSAVLLLAATALQARIAVVPAPPA
jgi:predicted MFS family arabinose efflux permease